MNSNRSFCLRSILIAFFLSVHPTRDNRSAEIHLLRQRWPTSGCWSHFWFLQEDWGDSRQLPLAVLIKGEFKSSILHLMKIHNYSNFVRLCKTPSLKDTKLWLVAVLSILISWFGIYPQSSVVFFEMIVAFPLTIIVVYDWDNSSSIDRTFYSTLYFFALFFGSFLSRLETLSL